MAEKSVLFEDMKNNPSPVMIDIEWPEMARILLAAKGIKTGLWRVAVKLRQAGIIAEFQELGSKKTEHFPTSVVGIQAIALMTADGPGPMVFNAAEVAEETKPRLSGLQSRRPTAKDDGPAPRLGAVRPKSALPRK